MTRQVKTPAGASTPGTGYDGGSSAVSLPLDPPRSLAWRAVRMLDRIAERMHRVPESVPAHARGRAGEDLAYWSLRQQGYTMVARNYRLPGQEGELDLIGVQGEPPCLVFIEVKTRSREGRFPAEDAVDAEKRRHLIRLARAYRRRCAYQGTFRYDVVTVHEPEGAQPRLRLFRNAFVEGN